MNMTENSVAVFENYKIRRHCDKEILKEWTLTRYYSKSY